MSHKKYKNWSGEIGLGVSLSSSNPIVIAGPCMFESWELGFEIGRILSQKCRSYDIGYVFKSSYDKANRTSAGTERGPGIEKGLSWLKKIREELSVPVITDVHTPEQAAQAGECVDMIQIPAFLSRHRALLMAAAKTSAVIQIKKGQWLSSENMWEAADFLSKEGNDRIVLVERGSCFGYNNLVVDFKNLVDMKRNGHAVVFDATHAVQLPGAGNGVSSGLRHMVQPLARAALAVGIDGLFMEVHAHPEKALSDSDTQLHIPTALSMIEDMARLRDAFHGTTKDR